MKSIKQALKKLNTDQRKIYNSIMRYFPATNPWSAYDKAIEGGTNFQFIPT